MATSFSASATPRIQFSSSNTPGTGISLPAVVDLPQGGTSTTFTSGSGALQASIGWADVRAYAATPTTLDLTSLSAAATNTGAAAFAAIKGLRLENLDATNAVTIGGAGTTPFAFQGWGTAANTLVLKAGAVLEIVDPSAAGMTCSTAKNLKVDPGANTVSVGICLFGI